MFVPVIDRDQQPLLPTTPSRARRWIKSGKAQPLAVGIDPGSRREGYSVVSAAHTYLNIQAEARNGVKDAEQVSTGMRRNRRSRKMPCRKPRQNRGHGKKKLPPSTRARWQWKLRLARTLRQLFPVSIFVVEDIKARSRGKRQWDQRFSPLEVGKQWFYAELSRLSDVQTRLGYETKAMRDQLGLKKTSEKLAEVWEAHCLDAWVLAKSAIGGKTPLDNRRLVCVSPLVWRRRQLHRLQPEKGGKCRRYGGTLSQGVKRGTLVKHPKWGKATIGGTRDGKVSLHNPETNRRLTQAANVSDCQPIKLLRWRTRLVPLAPMPRSADLKQEDKPPPRHTMHGAPQAESDEFYILYRKG